MSMLGRVHVIGTTLIAVGYALYRIALGSLMILVCAWLLAQSGDKLVGEILLLAVVSIWGLIIVVRALGPFVGSPSPDRAVKRETRKALRRAGMMRWWW